MFLERDARYLLAVAAAAAPLGPNGEPIGQRLAGGPTFTKDCDMVAVSPGPILGWQTFGTTGPPATVPCAQIGQPTYSVTYVRTCYPVVQRDRPNVTPADSDVTAWTLAYLAGADAIIEALAAAADGTGPVPAGWTGPALGGVPAGECSVAQLGPGQWSGPLGGVCWVTVPVTVSPFGAPTG